MEENNNTTLFYLLDNGAKTCSQDFEILGWAEKNKYSDEAIAKIKETVLID